VFLSLDKELYLLITELKLNIHNLQSALWTWDEKIWTKTSALNFNKDTVFDQIDEYFKTLHEQLEKRKENLKEKYKSIESWEKWWLKRLSLQHEKNH
jgi:recombinational DNA repair ATPase RecF